MIANIPGWVSGISYSYSLYFLWQDYAGNSLKQVVEDLSGANWIVGNSAIALCELAHWLGCSDCTCFQSYMSSLIMRTIVFSLVFISWVKRFYLIFLVLVAIRSSRMTTGNESVGIYSLRSLWCNTKYWWAYLYNAYIILLNRPSCRGVRWLGYGGSWCYLLIHHRVTPWWG